MFDKRNVLLFLAMLFTCCSLQAQNPTTINCPPPGCIFQGAGTLTMVPSNLPPSVTIAPATGSVQINGTLQFTATVVNDPFNLGVTWSVSGTNCVAAACGKISPLTSPSGSSVTYTAPPAAPAGSVIVTAKSNLNQASFSSNITVVT